MPKYYQEFAVTGVANAETLDAGLESTEAEKKRIIAVLVNVSGYADNLIIGRIERETIMKIYDKVFISEANDGDTNTPYSTNKLVRIELGHEIELGRTFKIGIDCGATNKNIHGAYEYEII